MTVQTAERTTACPSCGSARRYLHKPSGRIECRGCEAREQERTTKEQPK